jgi:4-carboxymuconolactone decarboxylase
MRLDRPRVPLTTSADWNDDSRPILEGIERNSGRILNIFRTLAHHPKLLKRWTVFGNHVLYGSTLPPRERELIILRTGYLCGSGYEWAQHAEIARRSGLSDAEIERIAVGPSAAEWSDDDRVLLVATDELSDAKFISDATWTQLSARWNSQQLLDIVFAVGQYTLVSMALNTFGVQLEHDTDAFPAALFIDGKFPLPRDRPQ